MAAATSFKLNTGKDMPALGLGKHSLHSMRLRYPRDQKILTKYSGTWQSKPGEVQAAVSYALKSGYKLVDCAYVYGNEEEVGKGLKEAFDAGVKREDIYIMTKVWASYNTRVEECLDKSLKSLGVDYVDMYLVVSTIVTHLLRRLQANCNLPAALACPHEPQW